MIIHSNIRDYEVNFEKDFSFLRKLEETDFSFYVIDSNVYDIYKNHFKNIKDDRLFILHATEENKQINRVLDICEKMIKIPAKRNATMITIGGGICQDISGFAANILYRGINWILVPTTLLAACDSCIGAKTSLNFMNSKNVLGTFYPPNKIIIQSDFFNTLSDRDFKSGLGEVVKFNLMRGLESIQSLEIDIDKLLEKNSTLLNSYIENSLNFKQSFIEQDEFDLGNRIVLNFAHTFGHAIEISSNYEIPHGTAVAIGTLMANYISVKRGLLEKEFHLKILAIVDKILSVEIKDIYFNQEKIITAMKNDKKRKGEKLAAVLINSKFETKVYHDLDVNEIVESINFVKNHLKGKNINEN